MKDGSIFFDTNILLYAEDTRTLDKRKQAEDAINQAWEQNLARCSWQVLNEFYVNATRKLGASTEMARDRVRMYQVWQPIDSSPDLLERAWHWMDEANLSYWDSLILAAAECQGCTTLVSEDFQANRLYGTVRILNPFA